MTKRELIDYCLTYPSAYEDYPFDDVTPILRHSVTKKMFAIVGEHDGKPTITLKCEPLRAEFLRSVYEGVIPGYHTNKKHWNTIFADSDVPESELKSMIEESFLLTGARVNKKNRKKPPL